jgi:hypothetical protein
MKSIQLFIAFAILSFFSSNAQITKGNWMVGGTGSFSYSKTENINNPNSGTTINYSPIGTFTIAIEPNIGYFFINKLAAGFKLNYINGFIEGEKLNINGMNLSIGTFIRYYFFKEEKMYNLFFEPSFSRFLSNSLGNANSLSLKSGFVIFMNNSVGFETSISYAKTSSSKFERNDIFLGVGFQIHLEKDK